jgi:hypothetical protein
MVVGIVETAELDQPRTLADLRTPDALLAVVAVGRAEDLGEALDDALGLRLLRRKITLR